MKKRYFIVIIALILAAALAVFAACGQEETEFERMQRLISHQQTELMTARNEHFEVIFTAGITETPFVKDGIAGETTDFARLRIFPRDYAYVSRQFNFELIGSGGSINGEFTKDALGIGFSADIEGIEDAGLPSRVIITERTENPQPPRFEFNLENRMSEMMTAEAALELAVNEFRQRIDLEVAEGGFRREIQLRLINDSSNFDSPHHWFISFIAGDFDYFAVLIEPTTGRIVSKRS